MLADEVRLQHMLDAARQAAEFIEERFLMPDGVCNPVRNILELKIYGAPRPASSTWCKKI